MLFGIYCPSGFWYFKAPYNLPLKTLQLLRQLSAQLPSQKKIKEILRVDRVDREVAHHEIHPADWRVQQQRIESLSTCRSRNIGAAARCVRDSFREYFCAQGHVSKTLSVPAPDLANLSFFLATHF